MKNKIIKFCIRILILFIVSIVMVVILVVQPVNSNQDYKPALTDSDSLKQHVYQLSEHIPQNVKQGYRVDASAEYIFSKISAFNTNVKYQDFDVKGVTYNNIELIIAGKEQCGTYVIGAHYDTYDNLPGADDNISGVAGLIELARLFSINPPKCEVRLVAYTLEEPPYFRSEYMGSYIHAKTMYDNNIDVKAMLSLEMIGYFNDEIGSQNYPVKGMEYLYSNKGDYIILVGDLSQIGLTRFFKSSMRSSTDLPVYSINAPTFVAGIDFSDHLNYWQFGYSAIMVTDTAFNRNNNYHTKHDTAEKLDYNRMSKVVDAVYYSMQEYMNQ